MQTTLLIDAIVRQTTVLIAQLSTAAGIRAPLSHVADEIFLHLASEIEAQGVGRKVVADMFGLALRSYQKKVQRITESSTEREHTLWEALLELIQREGSVSRGDLQLRFGRDGELAVASVLKDLVHSGLVSMTGRGPAARYTPTSERDRALLLEDADGDALANLVWLAIYRGAASENEVAANMRKGGERVAGAIKRLIADGRVRRNEDGSLSADTLAIPVGAEQGWEAAVLDHFQAMANAIANKVRQGQARSELSDAIGGGTLSFDLEPGHPHAQRVLQLLERVRRDANELLAEVDEWNREHGTGDDERRYRVWFYFGQNVEHPDEPEGKKV